MFSLRPCDRPSRRESQRRYNPCRLLERSRRNERLRRENGLVIPSEAPDIRSVLLLLRLSLHRGSSLATCLTVEERSVSRIQNAHLLSICLTTRRCAVVDSRPAGCNLLHFVQQILCTARSLDLRMCAIDRTFRQVTPARTGLPVHSQVLSCSISYFLPRPNRRHLGTLLFKRPDEISRLPRLISPNLTRRRSPTPSPILRLSRLDSPRRAQSNGDVASLVASRLTFASVYRPCSRAVLD